MSGPHRQFDRRALLAWTGARALWAAAPGRVVASPARYFPYDPHELAIFAHLVVAGSIRDVWKDTFVLEVEERLSPRPSTRKSTALKVQKFVDWPCANRWAAYAVGQRAVFYLRRPPTKSGARPLHSHLTVMGAGNEGECPIVDLSGSPLRTIHTRYPKVVFVGSQRILAGRRTETLAAADHEVQGMPIDYAVHVDAVTGLRKAFRRRGDERVDARIEQLLPDDDVDALARRSWFADLLVRCVRADERLDTGPGDSER